MDEPQPTGPAGAGPDAGEARDGGELGTMETLSEAIRRLQAAGYHGNLSAVAGGHLRCDECDVEFDPAEARVDETVRFEGVSDPGDESILLALSGPGDHRGLYTVAYGAAAPPDDAAALRRIRRAGGS